MSQVIEVRNEYRMAEFKDILAPRKARGLSVRAFCFEHGISQHTYYYRLRKLRQPMKGGAIGSKLAEAVIYTIDETARATSLSEPYPATNVLLRQHSLRPNPGTTDSLEF
ncbi:MAG: hypothetical protein R3Y62_03135 [Eubacteriales bacterium]